MARPTVVEYLHYIGLYSTRVSDRSLIYHPSKYIPGVQINLLSTERASGGRTGCGFRVQSLLWPGYRQTGWDSPTSRSQRVHGGRLARLSR